MKKHKLSFEVCPRTGHIHLKVGAYTVATLEQEDGQLPCLHVVKNGGLFAEQRVPIRVVLGKDEVLTEGPVILLQEPCEHCGGAGRTVRVVR